MKHEDGQEIQPSANDKADAFDKASAERLRTLEAQITQGRGQLRAAFGEIEREELYLSSGYPTFSMYLQEKWAISKTTSYRWIEHDETLARIREQLPEVADKISGRMLSALSRIAEEQQAPYLMDKIEQGITNGAALERAIEEDLHALDEARPKVVKAPKKKIAPKYSVFVCVPPDFSDEVQEVLGELTDPIPRAGHTELRKRGLDPTDVPDCLRRVADWFEENPEVRITVRAA